MPAVFFANNEFVEILFRFGGCGFVLYEHCRKCRMVKTIVNTTNFPTSFVCGRSLGVFCLYDF